MHRLTQIVRDFFIKGDKVLLLLCLVFVLTVLGMVYLPALFH